MSPNFWLKSPADMPLIQRVLSISKGEPEFLSKFKDCFGELGTLPGYYYITMNLKVKPIINPPHKVPFALKKKLKHELLRMTQLGIIVPVNEPTDWVSSRVVIEKPKGPLRVCLDHRNLNKTIKREHYCRPTATDIFQEMAGAQYFTKLDAFWQIKVDEKSFKLITFNSPCGCIRFLRIPYEIHSASEGCVKPT